MTAEAPHEIDEPPGEQAGNDERHAEAQRIDRQEKRPLPDRLFRAGDEKDRAEDGTDTRSPADREGKAEQIGAHRARAVVDVDAERALEERYLEEAEKMEPHDDDHRAADRGEEERVARYKATDRRCGGAKSDEDRRKSEHERRGGQHDGAFGHDLVGLSGQLIEAHARHVAKVGRHQRQDAGREKGHKPRQKGAPVGDFDGHSLSFCVAGPVAWRLIGTTGTLPQSPL